MPSEVPSAFRLHFRAHNRRVWALALTSVLAAAVVWWALYFALEWGGLLLLTVLFSVDLPEKPDFQVLFIFLATGLIGLHWLVTGVLGYRSEKIESFRWWKVLLDLLLIPAKLTFAGPENFAARVNPSEEDLEAAWLLLQHLQAEKKISLQQLPLIIPDPAQLDEVLWLLGLTGLTDTDDYGGTWWLHLKDDRSRGFVQRLKRLTEYQRNANLPRRADIPVHRVD